MKTHQHYIIHKPFGFISQFVNNKTRKKRLLGELYQFAEGTMAIGRLDAKSEGLLLLTTDGKLSDYICSSKVDKEYYVQLDGEISTSALDALETGVEIGFEGKRYVTKPCKARVLLCEPVFSQRSKKIRDERHGKTSWISITINEGKFRQVRKMTAAVGFPTLRLVRVRIGKIFLGEIPSGEVVEISVLEV
ncbi:pseudouridine synthase [Bacteroidota bacterium]